MNLCLHCNAENADDHRFCHSCGAALAPGQAADSTPVDVPGTWDQLVDEVRADASPHARLTLSALQWYRQGNLEDALLGAESALTMKADYWPANLLTGVIQNQRGQTASAEDHLQRAIHTHPQSVLHKAALERELIRVSPRITRVPSPASKVANRLIATTGALLVIIGLMAIANGVGARRSPRTGTHKTLQGVGPATAGSYVPPGQATPQPGASQPGYWTTQPRTNPQYPSGYAPPSQVAPPRTDGVPAGGHVTQDQSSDAGTPLTLSRVFSPRGPSELPAAQPDLTNLQLQPRQGGENPKPQPIDGQAAQAAAPAPAQPVRPRLGSAGPALIAPADKAPVATTRRWPQPTFAQAPPAPALPQPSAPATVAAAPRPQAPRQLGAADLQREGIRLMREQRYSEAQASLEQASNAYQRQIAQGQNVEAARRGLDTIEAMRRLAESRQ
ncbi:MAG TPA: zinc-ribbon domain-containing protein [Armatimonadota bacterium]|jgi:hypothetical protein